MTITTFKLGVLNYYVDFVAILFCCLLYIFNKINKCVQ